MWGWVEAIKNKNSNPEVLWEIFKSIVGHIQRLAGNLQKYRGKYQKTLCKIRIIIYDIVNTFLYEAGSQYFTQVTKKKDKDSPQLN